MAAKNAKFLRLGQTQQQRRPSQHSSGASHWRKEGRPVEGEADTTLRLSTSFKPCSPYRKGFGITTDYIVQTHISSHR